MSDPGLPLSGSAPASASPDANVDPSSGPRRVLIALYAVFAVAATSRAAVQLGTKVSEAPLAYSLSLVSGIIYIAATVGLISRRPFARPLALAACSTELVGVLIVGTLSLADSAAFPDDTVWSKFGSGYGFVPVILPILGIWFLLRQRKISA
ncbi:hypothetical protein EH165_11225 [Nakamurella antarctica]|uniref:Integral membrane protein n=1 Tax=Nakamurella antarctica TaxID=1902245 RepID=A0A3G8ZMS1_9ACTN|nr:hypothetical protein [Nakamurella antarctica]AZI58619.1 hypothetical protein EH165_11225 [Nakamurella antarctica]